jgi:RuvB-like protein 1
VSHSSASLLTHFSRHSRLFTPTVPHPRSGTDVLSPHGVPVDLLDRMLIIRTLPYTAEEVVQIVAIRARTEGIDVDDAALARLAALGDAASLRYAVQLLTPSRILASTGGREAITAADVEDAHRLFYDAKTSAKVLAEQGDKYLL